jgi:hypothetical protein
VRQLDKRRIPFVSKIFQSESIESILRPENATAAASTILNQEVVSLVARIMPTAPGICPIGIGIEIISIRKIVAQSGSIQKLPSARFTRARWLASL